jgi:predicted dehydrogenase
LKVAVVGLGYWGPNHVRNLLAIDSCTSVVAVDLDPARTAALAGTHSSISVGADLASVLEDDELDAVVLSTPVATHTPLARQILEAGKSVLVEKPLATSTADARELVELARSRGLLLACGHTFLFSPPVVTIRELVASGDLGELLYLQGSRVNLGIHNTNVSVLWDLAPHDLSIVMDWVGETPTVVSATGRASHRHQPPDVAFIAMEFPSGFVANLHLSWLAPTKIRRMTLVGTKKMVVYEDTQSEEPVKIYDKGVDFAAPEDFGQYQLTYRTGDVVSPRIPVWEPLRHQLEDFLRRVAAKEVPDAREDRVVDIIRVIEAADISLGQHGQPVAL